MSTQYFSKCPNCGHVQSERYNEACDKCPNIISYLDRISIAHSLILLSELNAKDKDE